jgi:thioredoxin reductase (NADPH)
LTYDLICVGAGPTGLACAMEAKRAGMKPLVIDKGAFCNSLYHYPTNLLFFTTSEKMEIGDLPMSTTGDKPTRSEALKYYRKAAEFYQLEVRLYEAVEKIDQIERQPSGFAVHTRRENGARERYTATRIVIATGYYDLPRPLGVPGEELPHVSHYYREAHPCWQQDVVVIGGKNSAAETALDLFRGGARVTLVHRGAAVSDRIKYWVKPDIENRIQAGEIKAEFSARVTRIEPGKVWVAPVNGADASTDARSVAQPILAVPASANPQPLEGTSKSTGKSAGATEERAIPANFIFAMTGYNPDFEFLKRQGIRLDPVTQKPELNPETLETNVPGMYVAGVVVGGTQTGEIFIENGRFHGKQIIAAVK